MGTLKKTETTLCVCSMFCSKKHAVTHLSRFCLCRKALRRAMFLLTDSEASVRIGMCANVKTSLKYLDKWVTLIISCVLAYTGTTLPFCFIFHSPLREFCLLNVPPIFPCVKSYPERGRQNSHRKKRNCVALLSVWLFTHLKANPNYWMRAVVRSGSFSIMKA